MLWCGVVCCVLLCYVVLCCVGVVVCCSVLWCVVLCCVVLCWVVLWCVVVCCGVLWCVVFCCGVLFCVVLCCAVLCCVVLCCVVLFCSVLFCSVEWFYLFESCRDSFLSLMHVLPALPSRAIVRSLTIVICALSGCFCPGVKSVRRLFFRSPAVGLPQCGVHRTCSVSFCAGYWHWRCLSPLCRHRGGRR